MADRYIPGVQLHAFQKLFPSSLSGLAYLLPEAQATGIDVWPQELLSSSPSVTTLEVKSGGGKTTLANCLIDFLSNPHTYSSCFSWVGIVDLDYEVSMIPQQPQMIMHWKVSDLLPASSSALETVFPGEATNSLYNKRLSQLSGGQRSRVLLASAVERIFASKATTYNLLLDEAFDGIDASLGNEILRGLLRLIGERPGTPHLRVLLISHFDSDIFLEDVPARRLSLQPVGWVDQTRNGDVFALAEVLVDEA